MSEATSEQVLVVPTALFHQLGVFQGFTSNLTRYLPALLEPTHLRYVPRSQAEEDPSFKQLIPYVVLRCGSQFFHYTRGQSGTEKRLQARRSIGVGGHISVEDGSLPVAGQGSDPYRAGLLRELHEEVEIDQVQHETMLGLINDDRTPVGQVHLGIVHLFDLSTPQVQSREQALAEAGFASLAELRNWYNEFETWSQFLLDHLT